MLYPGCLRILLFLKIFIRSHIVVLSISLFYFYLVFFSRFSIAITSLGEESAKISAFRTFVRFALV